ncbi:MAG: hybrid sensor histidine kinase/response regulator [Rhodothermales bacterium]
MRFRVYVVLLAGCLSVLPVVAQPLTTRSYTRADGLASDYVFAIFQDRDGFMWFGTDSGVVRFDGQQWTTFTTSDGLGANLVYDITQDARGRIWVGTFEGGAAWFDGTAFHRLTDSPFTVGKIAADGYGRVYMAEGTHVFVAEAGQTRSLMQGSESGLHGTSFVPHPDGHLLHPTPEALLWIAPSADTVRVHRIAWPEQIAYGAVSSLALVPQPDHRWWLIHRPTRSGYATLYDAQITPEAIALDSLTTFLSSLTMAAFAQDEHLILGDRNGFQQFDVAQRSLYTPPRAPNLYLRDVIADYEGQIWIATHGDGVQRVVGTHLSQLAPDVTHILRTRRYRDSSLVGISPNRLVQQRPDGSVWTSPNGERLFTAPAQSRHGMWTWATSGTLLQNRQLWAPDAARIGRSSAVYADLLFDHADTLWAATYGDGIQRFVDGAPVDTLTIEDGLSTNMIERLVRTPQRMWMLTRSHGASAYGKGQWMHITADDGLPSNAVFSVAETHDGAVWMGTDRGVARWDGQTMRVFDAEGRLHNERVVGLFLVEPGRDEAGLWVVTNRLLYHATADRLRSYGSFPLLPDPEAMIYDAAYDAEAQILHLATSAGLVEADLKQLHPGSVPPRVALYQLTAGNHVYPLRPDTTMAMPYTQNDVTVSFAALTFRAPEAARIQYRWGDAPGALWSAPTQNRTVTLLDVPDGPHRFEVRAINADGVVSEQAAAFTLDIIPPFWRTSWFRALSALVLIGGILMVIQYASERKARARMRALEIQRKLQHERTRISRDLHDHVGAQLSSLISGLELIGLNARRQKHDAVRQYATTLDEEARQTMAQLRETIWTLHDGPLTLDAFAHKTRDFLRRQATLHPQPPATSVSTEGDATLSPIQALNLFRIVQEATHNTLKHADAHHFEVHLTARGHGLTLTMTDDGAFRGHPTHLPLPTNGHGHGMANMRQRTEELGGTFALRTSNGTQLHVQIPLQMADRTRGSI